MLNRIKRRIIRHLWDVYSLDFVALSAIQSSIYQRYHEVLLLDHFALIDLPGPYTGITTLSRLFSYLDYSIHGQGYLVEKQNNFAWLTEKTAHSQLATMALPQIVVADFRREELDLEILKIVDYYAALAKPLDEERLKYLRKRVLQRSNEQAASEMFHFIVRYLQTRDWPLPTVAEFETLKRHNELLAWVLVRGRCVNHFAWAIHLSKSFNDLAEFNQIMEVNLSTPLNKKGGAIKGSPEQGIEQSSTQAAVKSIQLIDGRIRLAEQFLEFVWRHPKQKKQPKWWSDYFTGFITDNANLVVESLFDGVSIEKNLLCNE